MKTMSLLYCLPLAVIGALANAAEPSATKDAADVENHHERVSQRNVENAEELIAAARDGSINRIVVSGELNDVPRLKLSPGQTLTASIGQTIVRFADNSDGVQLSSNNKVENLKLIAAANQLVIFNDTSVSDFGILELSNLTLTGVVQLLAADRVRSGHVEAHGIDIVSSDPRAYDIRPKGYGVEVIPGAFTLWNQQLDPSIAITADLTGLSAGRPNVAVHGSGIFVSGGGDAGGRMVVSRLETGAVYSDAGIARGTANRISGGVFVAYGTHVDLVHTRGPVTTYGPNDMVLDNWGIVDRWISEAKISSHGPSGIGFVNFGTINSLEVKAPIETFGQGARGFNVYSGTVRSAEFNRVVTHGDGAVGIQIGRPVGAITVTRGIETFGGSGESLVKGVMTKLSAVALSVKAEGSLRKLRIKGGLITHGPGVAPLELQGGIESLQVEGEAIALGQENAGSQSTKTN